MRKKAEKTEEELIEIVKKDYFNKAFKKIKNPSEAVQIEAVKSYPSGKALKYIENPSEAVLIAAANANGYILSDIENPSEAVQLAATRSNPPSIGYLENPTPKVIEETFKVYGGAIKHIENPTEEQQLHAVTINPEIIGYIKDPSEKVQLTAIKNSKTGNTTFNDMLKGIKNPTEAAIKLILSKGPYYVGEINGDIPQSIIESTFSDLINKIPFGPQKFLYSLNRSKDNSDKVIPYPLLVKAVEQYPKTIFEITNPSNHLLTKAIRADPEVYREMKNPSEKATRIYNSLGMEKHNEKEFIKLLKKYNTHTVQDITLDTPTNWYNEVRDIDIGAAGQTFPNGQPDLNDPETNEMYHEYNNRRDEIIAALSNDRMYIMNGAGDDGGTTTTRLYMNELKKDRVFKDKVENGNITIYTFPKSGRRILEQYIQKYRLSNYYIEYLPTD